MSQCEPADDIHYVLDPEELTFLKKETGIEDEDALKAHILAIQRDAKKVGSESIKPLFYSYIIIRFTLIRAFAASDSSGYKFKTSRRTVFLQRWQTEDLQT